MAIAKRLKTYLEQHEVEYRLTTRFPTGSCMDTPEKAHVPGDSLAKGILVKNEDGYLMVVVPSDYHVELEKLHRTLQQEVELATEAELERLFPDCAVEAVPPIGLAYGIKTIWDPATTLGRLDKVYFEAGDHQHLVCVTGKRFHELMAPAEKGEFGHAV